MLFSPPATLLAVLLAGSSAASARMVRRQGSFPTAVSMPVPAAAAAAPSSMPVPPSASSQVPPAMQPSNMPAVILPAGGGSGESPSGSAGGAGAGNGNEEEEEETGGFPVPTINTEAQAQCWICMAYGFSVFDSMGGTFQQTTMVCQGASLCMQGEVAQYTAMAPPIEGSSSQAQPPQEQEQQQQQDGGGGAVVVARRRALNLGGKAGGLIAKHRSRVGSAVSSRSQSLLHKALEKGLFLAKAKFELMVAAFAARILKWISEVAGNCITKTFKKEFKQCFKNLPAFRNKKKKNNSNEDEDDEGKTREEKAEERKSH